MNFYKIFFLFLIFISNYSFASEGERFKYFSDLNPKERKSIQFIITTLGTKSTLTLLWHKNELEKAGSEIVYVHPLKFWKEVLTNQSLSSLLGKIGSAPKKRMIEDFSKSFEKMYEFGEINDEQLKDFSRATGYPYQKLVDLTNKKDWKSLVASFFKS